jgi:hypothetical protein
VDAEGVDAGSVDGAVVAWCRRWLGAGPVQVLFRAGCLSQVTGLRLADGRGVVVKVRPPAPRLRGCLAAQAALATAGFPCPRPLAGPAPLGALAATAEELVPGGHLLPPGPGAAARARLAELRLPPVVGHADWESQNLRWDGDRPLAVHDWDSAVAQPEAVVAGLASAVWPAAGGPGEAATVEQSEQFLTAYEQARDRPWTASERQACWAAGLWVRAFNAKKERMEGGGPQLDRLAPEVAERWSKARSRRPPCMR